MNPQEKRLEEIKSRVSELKGLDSRDETQRTEMANLIEEGKGLNEEIKLLNAAIEVEKWGKQPADGNPMLFHEKAGTETIAKTEKGWRSVDGDGQYIGSESLKMSMEPSYKRALESLCRFQEDRHDLTVLAEVSRKAMTEGLDTGGGYLVPADTSDRIISRKPHPSTLPGAVNTMQCSRDRLTLMKLNYTTDDIYENAVRIAWTGESGSASEDTGLEQWGEVTIPVFTGSFEIQASMDLLEDAAVNLEQFLVKEASSSYTLGIDNVIVNGTGVGQPGGILFSPGGTNEPPTVNIGNPVTSDNLIAWVYGLPPQYSDKAKALINRTNVFATWAQIKDTANNYIFGLVHNIDGGLANARMAQLLGYPVIFSAFMPNGGAGNNVGVYGDFEELYTRVQRVGLTVTPYGNDDSTMRRANRRGFHFRFREGGKVVQPRAARIGVQS